MRVLVISGTGTIGVHVVGGLLGREPRPFDSFASETAAAWTGS